VLADVAQAATEREACGALVELLGALLVRSAPGVPEMLLELVEQGPSDGEWSLRRLRDDLEASLLPLNRGATRRVLSRVLREVRRDADRSKGKAAPAPDQHSVDRALDDLLGVDPDQLPPTPMAVPVAPAPSPQSAPSEEIDATSLAVTVRPGPRVPMAGQLVPGPVHRKGAVPNEAIYVDSASEEVSRPTALEVERSPARAEAAGSRSRPDAKAAGSPHRQTRLSAESSPAWERATDTLSGAPSPRDGLDEFDSHATGEGGRGSKLMPILIAAAMALVAGYFLLGRDRAQQALGIESPNTTHAIEGPPAAAATPQQPANARHGTLTVSSTPARAQVLMLVGSGPAMIEHLPVGVAHEFVAMADGLAPARGLVPPGATWAQEGGVPRYELAVQLADAAGGGADLGPSRMPQAVGTPTGALGSVRVVTSPPGARVYQLIGFTPDVRVENLATDAPVELLLYVSGHALQRASVGPGDWKLEAGKLTATVDIKLARKGR
jgi:hypothetical protein